ncbi:xanthine dehydrogenase family protein subunit M [Tissierella sp.]|uniref:FAD binding domain-containing protein n=1 Tax=Tissierella sp. TaxID=41274 RepID=UPI00285E1F02|nr:xanthine dehydrogenase family protein subunit M [Tissierella sp.]MDR7855266.1 xanthine dehydrogenase family protein subunit M [Tissierella sp.]
MLSKFDYYRPDSLEKGLTYLQNHSDTKILAGGTDLMLLLRNNAVICEHILDIKDIPETKILEYTPGKGLFIGASIPVNRIAEEDVIREKYPALCHAADSLGSYLVRNRATLVGNICHASPGADTSAPLLVYDAKVHIASSEGIRILNLPDFFTGVKKTAVKENEIVLGVSLPDVEFGDTSIYLRKARIKGHDLCNVGLAMRLTASKEVYVALAAVEPIPLRLTELEKSLATKELNPELGPWIQEEIKKYMNPRRGSLRSSREFRLHIGGVLAKRGLLELIEKGATEYVQS